MSWNDGFSYIEPILTSEIYLCWFCLAAIEVLLSSRVTFKIYRIFLNVSFKTRQRYDIQQPWASDMQKKNPQAQDSLRSVWQTPGHPVGSWMVIPPTMVILRLAHPHIHTCVYIYIHMYIVTDNHLERILEKIFWISLFFYVLSLALRTSKTIHLERPNIKIHHLERTGDLTLRTCLGHWW